MNTRFSKLSGAIAWAVLAISIAGSPSAFAEGATPSAEGITTLRLVDGAELQLTSSFEVNNDETGLPTIINEAMLAVEITYPPGPSQVPGAHPPNPCRQLVAGALPPGPHNCQYFIRGETSTLHAQPSLMIALLLLQNGYASNDLIAQTLGYRVTITESLSPACPGGCSKLPSDGAIFELLFAQVHAIDPSGSAAIAHLLNQLGVFPPGPPTLPGSL